MRSFTCIPHVACLLAVLVANDIIIISRQKKDCHLRGFYLGIDIFWNWRLTICQANRLQHTPLKLLFNSLWFSGVWFAMAANPTLGGGEEGKQLHRLAQSKISLSLGRNICCFQWREIDNCLLFMYVIFIFPQ